jgi:AraC-like DNA-binding protein
MARRDNKNRTKYWCNARLPGMSLLHADFTTHDYAPHAHDAFVIALTEAGGAEIANERTVDRIDPSILFVSNPEERQSACMAGSNRWTYRSFYLTPSAMAAIAQRLGVPDIPYFAQSMFKDVRLIGQFGYLHRLLESEHDPLNADEVLIDAFGTLVSHYRSNGPRPELAPRDRALARRIIDLMQARYEENLELDELASAAGLTSFQLIGLFKRTVGLTPHAYLTHIRLNAACQHLKRGDTPAETALATGFYDQSALTKHFKRSYGITPIQFAEAARSS